MLKKVDIPYQLVIAIYSFFKVFERGEYSLNPPPQSKREDAKGSEAQAGVAVASGKTLGRHLHQFCYPRPV